MYFRRLYYHKVLGMLMKTLANIVYLFLRFFHLHKCYESPSYIVKYLRHILCIFFVTYVTKLIDLDVIVNSLGAFH